MKKPEEVFRVCKNPECPHHGEPQPIAQFRIARRIGNPWYRRTCRACESIKYQKYWAKNKEKLNAQRVWLKDQDFSFELTPMIAGGFVRWAVITLERRVALGEMSSFNGLSVSCDPPEPAGFDEVLLDMEDESCDDREEYEEME